MPCTHMHLRHNKLYLNLLFWALSLAITGGFCVPKVLAGPLITDNLTAEKLISIPENNKQDMLLFQEKQKRNSLNNRNTSLVNTEIPEVSLTEFSFAESKNNFLSINLEEKEQSEEDVTLLKDAWLGIMETFEKSKTLKTLQVSSEALLVEYEKKVGQFLEEEIAKEEELRRLLAADNQEEQLGQTGNGPDSPISINIIETLKYMLLPFAIFFGFLAILWRLILNKYV